MKEFYIAKNLPGLSGLDYIESLRKGIKVEDKVYQFDVPIHNKHNIDTDTSDVIICLDSISESDKEKLREIIKTTMSEQQFSEEDELTLLEDLLHLLHIHPDCNYNLNRKD